MFHFGPYYSLLLQQKRLNISRFNLFLLPPSSSFDALNANSDMIRLPIWCNDLLFEHRFRHYLWPAVTFINDVKEPVCATCFQQVRLVFNMTHPEISQRPPQLCGSFILFLCVIINHQNNNLCKRLFPFIHSINNSWRELLVRPSNVSGRDRGNNYQTSGEPCFWKLGECKEYDRPVWIIWGNYFYFIYKNRKIACVQVLERFC